MEGSLSHIYNWDDFSLQEREMIFNSHHKIGLKKGEALIEINQIANHYWCVESGLLRSYTYDFEGNEITTNFFESNEVVIDVVSLFKKVRSQETYQALTNCELWTIQYDDFQTLFHTIPAFREWGRLWMTNALMKSKEKSLQIITNSGKERYMRLEKEYPNILKQAPLKYIASFLGITDSSLSRIRAEIAQEI